MMDTLQRDFRAAAPAVDFCALRFVEETSEYLCVRQDVAEPPQLSVNRGAMVTVINQGGLGYGATSDLTPAGLREALGRARRYAELTRGRSVVDYSKLDMPRPRGSYRSPLGEDPRRISRKAKYELHVMRFDDTAYRVLGDNLEALTRERDLVVDDNSYGERSTSSVRTPGALVKELALTL